MRSLLLRYYGNLFVTDTAIEHSLVELKE